MPRSCRRRVDPQALRTLRFPGRCRTSSRLHSGFRIGGLAMVDFAQARRTMVDCQVRTSDVTDLRVIAALLDVARERFVPAARKADRVSRSRRAGERCAAPRAAQADGARQAGAGRRDHRDRPRARCRLRHRLFVRRARQARGARGRAGGGCGARRDGRRGACGLRRRAMSRSRPARFPPDGPTSGPYDVILLQGASEVVPDSLLGQLKEGGRLLAVHRQRTHGQGDDLSHGGARARRRSRCSTPRRRCCRASPSRRHSFSSSTHGARRPHDRTAQRRLWPRCATPQLLSPPDRPRGFNALTGRL